MRLTIVQFLLMLVLALAVAGPVSKISEKKSLVDNTKLVKEVPKIEEIGDEKDRSKKSTTTFCVEIRPGSNEPVQIPCACKNKEGNVPQLSVQQTPDSPALYSSPQSVPAHPHSPQSVNIIHAPSQPPQTLNIIQPAPTLHAVQFLQPQGNNPPAIQTLNFLQPSAQLSEPAHQSVHITLPSKPESELSEPVYSEKIILPPSESAPQPESQPAPQPSPLPVVQPVVQPAAQPEHGEHSHKSEVHVSVMTEDKKDNEEQKPYSEVVVQPPRPVETIKVVPVAPIRQPYEEQVVVVPNPVLVTNQQENCPPTSIVQVPSVPYGANYESVIQVPGSTFQQSGPFHTECSCKQTHPAHPDASSSLRTHFKDKGTKIIPMIIYPPAASSAPVSSPAHYTSELASLPRPSSYPMVIMQTTRNKDGMQPEEMSDMKTYKSMDGSARYSYDQNPNMYYDMSTGMQLMDIGRQAAPTLENRKEEENMMKTSGLLNEPLKPRFTRNDKDAKINEKIIEEKTSSTKIA
ncbi:bromodomain-containing protein 4-like [Vespula maculifrons]|uniref:Bromodomain-containing protein 4-like n=1 Tax=Vespula maculifrons TaxID=7453 RepID=A0ABD2CFS6_VESMC